MENAAAVIRNTVPISQFNRGMAGRIFEEVKKSGAKVVIKNNQPECVLMSPDEYIMLIEELNDAKLLALAEDRFSRYDPSKTYSIEDIEKEFDITQEDYDRIGEAAFE